MLAFFTRERLPGILFCFPDMMLAELDRNFLCKNLSFVVSLQEMYYQIYINLVTMHFVITIQPHDKTGFILKLYQGKQ